MAATDAVGVGIVTRMGQAVIDAQLDAAADDLGLRPTDQRAWMLYCSRPSTLAFVARLAIAVNAAMYCGRQSG